MISHYYRNVHAVLFVYDVTNLQSFENLTYWIEEYNKNCESTDSKNIPRILVGNKCDLESDVKVNTNVANQLHRARVQSIDHQNLNSSSNASSTDNGSCYC